MRVLAAERFRGELLAFLRSRLPNPADAEDLLHDTLLKLYTTAHPPDPDRLRSWLGTVLRNSIADFYRRLSREQPSGELEHLAGEASRSAAGTVALSSDPRPEARDAYDRCATDWLRGLVDTLPDRYRAAIIAVEIEGHSQKQWAHAQGLPYPTAKSLIQRGRDRLRRAVLDCCRVLTESNGNIALEPRRPGCCPPAQRFCA